MDDHLDVALVKNQCARKLKISQNLCSIHPVEYKYGAYVDAWHDWAYMYSCLRRSARPSLGNMGKTFVVKLNTPVSVKCAS